MELIENTALQLKKDFPVYTFLIYRGLFEKYIAVEVHGKVAFTIWVDKSTGYKELLDETYFSRVWWKRRFKTRLFHWSKQRRLGWGSYPEKIMGFDRISFLLSKPG